MYGLVNAAVQELVVTQFGADKWEQIAQKVGFEGDDFTKFEAYPDELTYKLVGAASEVLGIPPDAVMEAFGEWWVLYTGKEGYGYLFDAAGGSLRGFLRNLDVLHQRVGTNFPALRPPHFAFDDLDGGNMRMHYHSERAGLCPMVGGLISGLGKRFDTPLELEHDACVRNGADHCEFVLRFQDKAA